MNTRQKAKNKKKVEEESHKRGKTSVSNSTKIQEIESDQEYSEFSESEEELILSTPSSPKYMNLESEGASVLLSLSKGKRDLSEDEKKQRKKQSQQIKKNLNSKKRKIQEEIEMMNKRRALPHSTFDENLDQLFLETKNVEVPNINLKDFDRDFIDSLSSYRNLGDGYEFPPPIFEKSNTLPQNAPLLQEKVKEKKKPKEKEVKEKPISKISTNGTGEKKSFEQITSPTEKEKYSIQTGNIPKEKSIQKYKRASQHIQIAYFIYNKVRKQDKKTSDPTSESKKYKDKTTVTIQQPKQQSLTQRTQMSTYERNSPIYRPPSQTIYQPSQNPIFNQPRFYSNFQRPVYQNAMSKMPVQGIQYNIIPPQPMMFNQYSIMNQTRSPLRRNPFEISFQRIPNTSMRQPQSQLPSLNQYNQKKDGKGFTVNK